MLTFNDILIASAEKLLQEFQQLTETNRLSGMATSLRIRPEQLICAIGFNPYARYLTEMMPAMGFATYDELVQERNGIFTTDIYKRLSLDNVLKIYETIRDNQETLQVMQYLLRTRLNTIESEIESTVNSMIIEKYKGEMRGIYNFGIANIDFTEERLDRLDSGFRALLNEVSIIVESKIIPVGEIFFRNTILPQEKQKLLNKGLIPRELVQSRINEDGISPGEKKILIEYLKMTRNE